MIASKAYHFRDGPVAAAEGTVDVPHVGRQHVFGGEEAPGYSTKLEYLAELFDGLFTEPDRKALLFSEWTTMLDLIAPMLAKRKLDYVRLDGSVPQKKRQQLVQSLPKRPELPAVRHHQRRLDRPESPGGQHGHQRRSAWNPAVLEQRIGRAHRMGQRQPVHVYVLVTEGTIEESLLATLSAKHDLALAALDPDSEVTQVDFTSGVEEFRRRLEVLLGAQPEAPLDCRSEKKWTAAGSAGRASRSAWPPLAARCSAPCSTSSASWSCRTRRKHRPSPWSPKCAADWPNASRRGPRAVSG